MVTFHIRQEKFEGPLELLLELIEGEKMAISEISLARAADEYLVYVRSLTVPDPEELAEFLVVAAQLMLIKSRSLLPQLAFSEEEEASLDDLERRLAILKEMRDAAQRLTAVERKGMRSAGREAYAGMPPIFYPPSRLRAGMLADAFTGLAALIPKPEKLAEEKLKRIVSLEEKITHIRSIFQDVMERGFSEIVKDAKEKVEIVMSFLALLELARQKFVTLRQEVPFSDIMIKKTP